ncbi:hypothetical protein ACF0H5_019987 [Mactra antiquata]
MSVQVKTPTKSRFENNAQLLCGDRSFSSPENFRRSKDDLNIRNESKLSQTWNRKRRYSQSSRREEGTMRRKRLKSTPVGPLPNRFLNGGSIDDPLNLNGLDSSELGKQLNSITPQSSPLPTPVRRQSIEVRLPFNISDPLNLDNSDDEQDLEKMLRKKKQRNRHKKRDDSLTHSPQKNVSMDKSLLEALKIDINPDQTLNEVSTSKEFQKPRPVSDKIVSPVIRQISPKSKKRRRTNSGSKPEPSASVSRTIQPSTISPSLKSDKKTPPKRPKQQRSSVSKNNVCTVHKGEKTDGKFIYGNYNRYYGYRNPSLEDDKRLDCFNKDWFEGKCVLDIGCNVGQLTLSIAKDYHPSKVVGIDIDAKLIAAARKNIRHYLSSNMTDANKYPISNILNYGPIVAPPVVRRDVSKHLFPHNVLFMQGNYVLETDELLDLQKEEYDVILALSVTKWIHFNWGDAGLKRFFKRIFRQLRPGGRFILEPQPWSSYKKKKKLTETIAANYKSIQLRPEHFIDYLLSKEVGFSTCNTLDVPYNASKGFRRPLILFTKSDTVQSSPWSEVGNATPVQRRHPAVFDSHLSHMSEDSSCSCSSSSQMSSVKDNTDDVSKTKCLDSVDFSTAFHKDTDAISDPIKSSSENNSVKNDNAGACVEEKMQTDDRVSSATLAANVKVDENIDSSEDVHSASDNSDVTKLTKDTSKDTCEIINEVTMEPHNDEACLTESEVHNNVGGDDSKATTSDLNAVEKKD